MPYLTVGFGLDGPIAEILVGVAEPRRQVLLRVGFSVPTRVRARALIDTGSSVSAITPQVASALGLTPLGQIAIHTPSTLQTPHQCNQYAVSVGVTGPEMELYLPIVTVIETEFTHAESIHALFGRDLLQHCLFIYDGQHKTFSLAY